MNGLRKKFRYLVVCSTHPHALQEDNYMTANFFCNLKHTIRKKKKFSIFLSFSCFFT
jgi:hypothetical protein